jgi:hypothetical protein
MTDPHYFTTNNTLMSFEEPKPRSKWILHLTPGGYVRFHPPEGDVPCWFHRQTQRLCFGVVWKRDQ